MKRRVLIESFLDRKRMAVFEDGVLAEYAVESSDIRPAAGNIYKGIVREIIVGIKAAFVNIGLERNAYLSLDDMPEEGRLKRGQEVIVQVIKEQTGEKGPRVTRNITLAGSMLVYLPYDTQISVSHKITEKSERNRLTRAVRSAKSPDRGVIIRTAAEGVSEEAIAEEVARLETKYSELMRRAEHEAAPVCLMDENALECRAVRDMLTSDTTILTDSREIYAIARECAMSVVPERADAITFYANGNLFDDLRVDALVDSAFSRTVHLPGGGTIVIDYTEALTAIDVNTGTFAGGATLEDTIFKVNTEAAVEIARQLRLRDIGGIIIVDFIDMTDREHETLVLETLRNELKRDRVHIQTSGFSDLGLVEISRQKLRKGVFREMRTSCPLCGGSGMVKDDLTAATDILSRIVSRRARGEECVFLVAASAGVCERLRERGADMKLNAFAYPDRTRRADEYDISPAAPSEIPSRAARIGKE